VIVREERLNVIILVYPRGTSLCKPAPQQGWIESAEQEQPSRWAVCSLYPLENDSHLVAVRVLKIQISADFTTSSRVIQAAMHLTDIAICQSTPEPWRERSCHRVIWERSCHRVIWERSCHRVIWERDGRCSLSPTAENCLVLHSARCSNLCRCSRVCNAQQ
jgi:hypothetical protein